MTKRELAAFRKLAMYVRLYSPPEESKDAEAEYFRDLQLTEQVLSRAEHDQARREKRRPTKCIGSQRHWFTVYGEPGNATAKCQRCGVIVGTLPDEGNP